MSAACIHTINVVSLRTSTPPTDRDSETDEERGSGLPGACHRGSHAHASPSLPPSPVPRSRSVPSLSLPRSIALPLPLCVHPPSYPPAYTQRQRQRHPRGSGSRARAELSLGSGSGSGSDFGFGFGFRFSFGFGHLGTPFVFRSVFCSTVRIPPASY